MDYWGFEGRLAAQSALSSNHNVYKKRYDRQFSYRWDNKTVNFPLDADRS